MQTRRKAMAQNAGLRQQRDQFMYRGQAISEDDLVEALQNLSLESKDVAESIRAAARARRAQEQEMRRQRMAENLAATLNSKWYRRNLAQNVATHIASRQRVAQTPTQLTAQVQRDQQKAKKTPERPKRRNHRDCDMRLGTRQQLEWVRNMALAGGQAPGPMLCNDLCKNKTAFREQIKLLHPDKNSMCQEEANAAYVNLRNGCRKC
jgi:hypothetical protein